MPMDGVRRDGEIALRFDLPGVDPESAPAVEAETAEGEPALNG
jgi:hypothetical protein